MRRRLGLTYWSLSAWAKLKVKNAVNFIGRFEELLAAEASAIKPTASICGHIHHAAMHDQFGICLRQHRRLGRVLHRRRSSIMTAASRSIRWTDVRQRERPRTERSRPTRPRERA